MSKGGRGVTKFGQWRTRGERGVKNLSFCRASFVNVPWMSPKTFFVSDPTDVVCVIGIVKVKVRGQVQNGERIYASLSPYPGVAMPEHVIKQVTSEELTLIGQSLESVKDESPDAVHLVSCFVSILLTIQSQHTNKALSDLRTDVLGTIDSKIKRAKKRLLRGGWACVLM